MKYCRDAWPENQERRAEKQYEDLAEALEKVPGQTVKTHPVVLGVGGTIYGSTVETLKNLGAPRDQLQRALTELHCMHVHAVTNLHGAIRLKRVLEHQHYCRHGRTRNGVG